MTYEQLVRKYAKDAGITIKEARKHVRGVCDCIRDAVASGEDLKIPNFLHFRHKRTKGFVGADPRNKKPLKVGPYSYVIIKQAEKFRQAVRGE